MKGWAFAWLLWRAAWACSLSDGSALAPFFVNETASLPPTGDSCAPFPSLQAALSASSSLSAVTISLQSSATFPFWTVSNSLTLLGNFFSLAFEEFVQVEGDLTIREATLTSTFTTEYILSSAGPLNLHHCTVQGFVSPPIVVITQVTVTHSVFVNNTRGVFYSLRIGGSLNLTDSQFLGNAVHSGAVFFVYPSSNPGSTYIRVSDCEFAGNGNIGASSVLALNDKTVSTNRNTVQWISFSRCWFRDSKAATFQLTSMFFDLTVQDCRFEREAQLLTGQSNRNVTIARVSAMNCAGPLVVLALSGNLSIQSSNFTDTNPGPVVYVTGSQPSASLVYLSELNITNIANPGSTVYGILLNAMSATVWMSDIRLSHFQSAANGLLYLSQTVLYSQGLYCLNGTSSEKVIGQFTASTVVMNATVFDALRSRGSMAICTTSSLTLRQVTFRRIEGFWNENVQVYTTSFLLLMPGSNTYIEALTAELVHPGSTLLYVFEGQCSLSDSRITGPLGMGLFTIMSGNVTVKTTALHFTEGRTLAKLLLGGQIHFDLLQLQDLQFSAPILTLSSQSAAYIDRLVLTNMSAMALSKGENYKVVVGGALIERSSVSSLAHFSIAV